jgi:tetratricopeptide (TPR) repeat protein
LQALGDYQGTRQHYQQALEIGEATLGSDHLDMATWHSGLGIVLADLGDLAGARTHCERALEITQATLGPDHPKVAIVRGNLDNLLQQLGGE